MDNNANDKEFEELLNAYFPDEEIDDPVSPYEADRESYNPYSPIKKHSFVDVIVDEKEGFLSIMENGAATKTYRIKTEKEKEEEKDYRETRNSGKAITHMISVLAAISFPISLLIYQNTYESMGFKEMLSMMGISLLLGLFAYFAIILVAALVVQVFSFDKPNREDKKLLPTILTVIIWAAIVLAFSLIFS